MSNLFIIYTPYQMMSALSVIDTYKLHKSDFVLMHKNMEQYADIIRSQIDGRVFYDEFLYDTTSNKGWVGSHLVVLNNILKKKRWINHHCFFSKSYDSLYVPSDDSSCRVIYYYFTKKRRIHLYLFDDGVGTYSGYVFIKKKFISRILYTILLNRFFYEELEGIYCYHPELLTDKPEKIPTFSIKECNFANLFRSKINQNIKDSYLNKKVVFLDQGIDFVEMDDILNVLKKYFLSEEIVVKKHPRIDGKVKYDDFIVSNDGLPSEAIASVFYCNDSLIVTYSSTGGITPYLLKIGSPYVIMLSGIDHTNSHEIQTRFFDKINKVIGTDYIKLPRSVDEFEKDIVEVSGKLKGITLK